MQVLKRIKGWRLTVAGEQHKGWLPPGAAKPLPTSNHELTFDMEIQS
jgi:hypothetical protein